MNETPENLGEIIIYQDGSTPKIEVKLENDTVWLSQAQLAELFGRDQSVISRHIKNATDEGEITVKSNMQNMHIANSDKPITYYDLDTIISVGYRVKSLTGVRFRRWATNILRTYTVKGVVVNEKRLAQLGLMLDIVSRSEIAEVAGVGEVIKDYVGALHLLEDYDENSLFVPKGSRESWQLTYDDARKFLDTLRSDENFGANFASERSEHFRGLVSGLYQTFGGNDLYGSVEEKAANLLYQVVKDHPFVDGNKRSAAALFIYFLAHNKALQNINSNMLAAVTLMTALSKPSEKEQIILLIRNFLSNTI